MVSMGSTVTAAALRVRTIHAHRRRIVRQPGSQVCVRAVLTGAIIPSPTAAGKL
jgi:hypothetical protein